MLMSLIRLVVLALLGALSAHAGTDVLTHQYDGARSGANLKESTLVHGNVTRRTFGRLHSYRVDGPVMTQPLLAADVQIPGVGMRDLLFIATGSNSLYAFDASDATQRPLWHRELVQLPGGLRAQPGGILGTPIIDRPRNALYVVAPLTEGDHGRFVLHALDLRDGRDLPHSPLLIQGAVKAGDVSIPFEPTFRRIAVQRAALALAGDRLIIAFGGDFFEGWIFSYDTLHLERTPDTYCTTCASRVQALSGVDYLDQRCTMVGPGGGIWQSGRGPVVDANGIVYFFTGNKQHVIKDGCAMPFSDNACSGCRDPKGCVCKGNRASGACRGADACEAHQAPSGVFDTHDALIALSPDLQLQGWYRPENWNAAGVHGLEYNDLDLGGSGPTLLAEGRLIGGGKQGVMYVLDVRQERPGCAPNLEQTCIAGKPVQSFQVAPVPLRPNEYSRHLLGGTVLWQRSPESGGSRAYVWRVNDTLRSYRLGKDGFLDCDTDAPAPTASHDCRPEASSAEFIDHHPGGVLTLSANGGDAASAIVWASKAQSMSGPASLMAFKATPDAANPSRLEKIWSSEWCEGDALDAGSDFVPPVVADGRVYLGTSAGSIEVFGLHGERECVPQPERINLGPMLQ